MANLIIEEQSLETIANKKEVLEHEEQINVHISVYKHFYDKIIRYANYTIRTSEMKMEIFL